MAEIDVNFRLEFLPLVTSLPTNEKAVIDHMTDGHVTEVYEMVKMDAENGVGFAIDEYETEEDFREEVCEGFGFAVLTEDRSAIIAAFFIIPSRFCRDGRAADPIILVRSNQRGKKLGIFCSHLVMQFAPKLGFVCIYFDIFANNKAMLHIVNSIDGMKRVGHLPYAGRIHTGEVISADVYFCPFVTTNDRPSPVSLE